MKGIRTYLNESQGGWGLAGWDFFRGSLLPTQVGKIGKGDRLAGTFSWVSTLFSKGPSSGGGTSPNGI